MIKVAKCDVCGNLDITGLMACTGKQLCPKCTGQILEVPEEKVRESLREKLERGD